LDFLAKKTILNLGSHCLSDRVSSKTRLR